MINYLQLFLRLKDLLHQGSMLRPTGLHRRHLFQENKQISKPFQTHITPQLQG